MMNKLSFFLLMSLAVMALSCKNEPKSTSAEQKATQATTSSKDLTNAEITKFTALGKEIAQALKIGADFILLSPVKRTASHPEMEGIGWAMFAERVADVPIPVFALGGMQAEDLEQAKQSGAQGVAAISGFWPH